MQGGGEVYTMYKLFKSLGGKSSPRGGGSMPPPPCPRNEALQSAFVCTGHCTSLNVFCDLIKDLPRHAIDYDCD